jgi:DNA mismatch repair protein MutL
MKEVNSKKSSNQIHLLPEHIIDQIKAGEVIERPATLLKELLENSIDAGATKISIQIINYGLDLIAVEDNGKGMRFEELPLAFCRHATSKLTQFEDLYHLFTYGFRGEALASMSSVSKVTCTSNMKNSSPGTLKLNGGETISHLQDTNTKENSGTQIYVKDLFYNTPVRMKFMQSQTTEKNHLKKIVNAFLLTHPEVEFSLKWDEDSKEVYPIVKEEELASRVKKIFEKKKSNLELLNFTNDYDGIEIRMLLSLNSSKGNAGKFQYIFINDRYVQDVSIHKIILNSSQILWPFGETGNYIAFIYIAPEQLDVNVHPNKTVIKLFQPSKVYSLLSSSIKQHLPKQRSMEMDGATGAYQSQAFMPGTTGHENFKEINYRPQEFTPSNSLSNYFDNLDNNTFEVDQTTITLFKDDDATIVSQNEEFILINNNAAILYYTQYLMNKTQDKTSVPLLVSSPITVTKKITKQRVQEISNEGFEIDYLDEKTLVLRAFPKYLSHLPHEEIINILLNEKTVSFDKKWSISLDQKINYIPSLHIIKCILENLNCVELIKNKIIKKIKGKDLLGLL